MSQTYVVEDIRQRVEVIEAAPADGLPTRIKAVVQQADKINRNQRIYPRAVLAREVTKFMEDPQRRPGLVDHPFGDYPSVADIGIKWERVWMESDGVVWGEGTLVPTSKGNDLRATIAAGVEIGISSRGYATADKTVIGGEIVYVIADDYELETFDAVVDPAVAEARIKQAESFGRPTSKTENEMNEEEKVVEEAAVTEAEIAQAEAEAEVVEILADPVNEAVPENVSTTKASEDASWSRPSLSDFTDKAWDDLSDEEKRRIAGHFAYAESMPPETYGALKLPHHDPKTGDVVLKGCEAAMAACNGARGGVDLGDDRKAVYDHLAAHYRQFDKEPPAMKEAAQEPVEEPIVEEAKQDDTVLTEALTAAEQRAAALEAQLAEAVGDATTLKQHVANLETLIAALVQAAHDSLDREDFYTTCMFASTADDSSWLAKWLTYMAEDPATMDTPADESKIVDEFGRLFSFVEKARLYPAVVEACKDEKFGLLLVRRVAAEATSLAQIPDLVKSTREALEQTLVARRASIAPRGVQEQESEEEEMEPELRMALAAHRAILERGR